MGRPLKALFAEDLHAKRVLSLAGATLGVIESASLAVGMIGQGLALARGRLTKHAIKQVDRFMPSPKADPRLISKAALLFSGAGASTFSQRIPP